MKVSSYIITAGTLAPLAAAYVPHNKDHSKTLKTRDTPSINATVNSGLVAASTDPTMLNGQTFDYVIAGGGTAGLALASRLSENSSVTVAVIEAGGDGNDIITSILSPAQAYLDGVATMTSPYDWHYQTTNQSSLNGRQVFFPRGKILGGSSAVNGLYMLRNSAREQNAWRNLLDSDDARQYWTWENQYEMYKRSEHFDPPLDSLQQQAHIVIEKDYHGVDGPIHYGYPGFMYPQQAPWVPTFESLGVTTVDPYGGNPFGVFIAPSAINSNNYTRSYAKTGYYDPIAQQRTNLHILTGYQATLINFDDSKTATGVTFQAANGNGSLFTVNATQEVIISAGVIGTPQLLQLSGIGPSDLLNQYNISVISNLPGVGYNFQDHLSAEISFRSNTSASGDQIIVNKTFAAAQWNAWLNNDPQSMYNAPNDAIAYLNLTTIFNNSASATNDVLNYMMSTKDNYVSSYSNDSTISTGFSEIYDSEVKDILSSDVGAVEILLSNTGTYGTYGQGNTISIQVALQHPLSRGSVTINSNNPFDLPDIDPGYLTHPADIVVLRQGFKYARNLAATPPLSNLLQDEVSPGNSVNTDQEWEDFIRKSGSTEYHPAGTAAMLPQNKGGVIDNSLRVYGVQKLRVADTSIIPFSLSAHLCSPAYAIGETAAQILKGESYAAANTSASTPSNPSTGANNTNNVVSNSTSSSDSASSSSPSDSSSNSNSNDSAAASDPSHKSKSAASSQMVSLTMLAIVFSVASTLVFF